MNEHPLGRADQERRDDLLVQRATVGLSDAEGEELRGLLATSGGDHNGLDESLELSAAAIDSAMLQDRLQQPPAWLREKVIARLTTSTLPASSERSSLEQDATRRGWSGPLSRREWLAPACALAFAGLAAFAWFGVDREAASPTARRQLDEFLRDAPPDLVRLSWKPTEDPAAASASGEVVWSDSAQKGFMLFRGLPANDAALEQYQLWIFDKTRDAAQPVDGGVFDIRAGETIVPIRAKLEVREATMFAITIEPPGGVVVSKRERLPLLAQVSGE